LFSSCESGCPPLSALRWIVIQARDSLRLRFFPLTMHHRDWAASAEVKSGNAGGKKETLEKINKRKKKKKMQVRPKLVSLDATGTLFRVRGSVGEAYVRSPCHRFCRGGGAD
jgi:hypothetical protein